MNTRLILALVVCSLGTAAAQQQDRPPISSPDFASSIVLLEKWITAQMEFRGCPGLAIAVVHDREILWTRGFGLADLKTRVPVTPRTVFRIASITKTFTSTAIMILRDEGKLALDDPVSRYLPWFRYRNRFPDGPEVTIRQLLTHTSGLPREAAFPYWTDHVFPTTEQMIAAFHEQESIFEPETRYKYSNLGMAILGEVVGEASGIPYEEFIRQRILAPLGMASSAVLPGPAIRARMATGYGRRRDDGSRTVSPETEAKGLAAAANMASTVEDMAKYALMHLREDSAAPGQIVKGSTLREMHRVHWLQPSWKSGSGLGFSVSKSDDRVTFGHGGWVAGHRSQLLVSPAEKIGVIVMTNSDDGVPALFAGRALAMLAPAIGRATAAPKPEVSPDTSWRRFVGRYTDPWGWDTEVLIHNGHLMMYDYSYPPEENPLGSLVELSREGPGRFRMTGENGNGEMVIFEPGADGSIRRIKVGENYLTPKR